MTAHGGGWNIVVFKNSFIDDHSCCTILIDRTVNQGYPRLEEVGLIELYKPLKGNAEEGKKEGKKRVGKETEEGIKWLAACKQSSAFLWQSPAPYHCPVFLYLLFKTSNSVCSHSLTLCVCTASTHTHAQLPGSGETRVCEGWLPVVSDTRVRGVWHLGQEFGQAIALWI